MKIVYKDITLRDMVETDIEDDIRWNTVQMEWALWDAPWEMEVELPKFDADTYRQNQLTRLSQSKDDPRWGFELDTLDGTHIGSVNSYLIDENWNWVSANNVERGQKTYRTLGIEICESQFWSRGLGTQALAAFIQYYITKGIHGLCLQTWSGNIRMVKCASRLGFVECHREIGNRFVRGDIYDGLTFKLDLDRFTKFLTENS